MPVTQTTRTTYGQRLKNSGSAIVGGLIMFVIGTIILFWNEGRTIKTTRMIKQADKECVELPEVGTLDPSFDGKLVHLTGFATTEETFADSTFGIFANDILSMKREVEYYQMVERTETETKKKLDGSEEQITTYYYDEKWVSDPVDSKDFYDSDRREANWTLVTCEDREYVAQEAVVGAYKLPESMVASLSNEKRMDIHPDQEYLDAIDEIAKRNFYTRKDLVQVADNSVYIGLNPAQPAIGDVRVRFYAVPKENVSILARIQGDSFAEFVHKNGKSMRLIRDGVVSKDEMIEQEKAANKALAWGLRILGFLLIYFGLKNIFKFVDSLFKIIPIVTNIVSFGIGLACFIVALAWSIIVISVGWIFYRPVLGIIMLVAGAAAIWFVWKKGKEKREAEAAAAPANPAPAPAPAPEAPAAPAAPAPEAPAPEAPAAPETPADKTE